MPGIEVNRGITGGNLVALTYDDGPAYPEATREILDVLQKASAKATFFVVGRKVCANPQLLKDIHAAGMDIGNHTFEHCKLRRLDRPTVKDEILRTHKTVEDLIGVSMRHFRAPSGVLDDDARDTIKTEPELARLNYDIIKWTVDTKDYRPDVTAQDVYRTVASSSDLDGAIVLMHDGCENKPSRPLRARPTVEATRRLVPWLLDRGYKLVSISDIVPDSL